jgi:hypothetical protein
MDGLDSLIDASMVLGAAIFFSGFVCGWLLARR